MVLRCQSTKSPRFRVRECHPLRRTFPGASATATICHFAPVLQDRPIDPTTPIQQRLQACTGSVWARPPSLAATRGVSVDFFSSGYLDGSVPRVGAFAVRHDSNQVSPFGNPRVIARLPARRGLSQAPTSFIASRCQGIHHVPFNNLTHFGISTRMSEPEGSDARVYHHSRTKFQRDNFDYRQILREWRQAGSNR